MPRYVICLDLPPEEIQRYYQGHARWLHARAQSGERIQLPLDSLRGFVTHAGLQGCFEVLTDAGFKLQAVNRLQD